MTDRRRAHAPVPKESERLSLAPLIFEDTQGEAVDEDA
jgi:hypothetical protein